MEKEYNRREMLGRTARTAAGFVIPAYLLTVAGCEEAVKKQPALWKNDPKLVTMPASIRNFYTQEFGSPIPNPSPEQVRQAYLRHGFGQYPKELNSLANQHWKDKEYLESIVARGGWVVAGINDLVEFPLAAIGGFLGKLVGGKKAKKNVQTFVRYTMDGVPGGETYNHMCEQLVRLNGNGLVDVAYNSDGKAGGIGKIVIAGASTALAIILPFVRYGGGGGEAAAGAGPTPGSLF